MVQHGGNRQAIGRQYGIDSQSLLDFSANINPLGPPPNVRQTIEGAFDELLHYPDNDYVDLINAIAQHHQIKRHYVLPGNGEAEMIYLLAASLKAKKVLLLAPTFSEYEAAFSIAGSQCEFLWLKEEAQFQVDLKSLLTYLEEHPTIDCLCLCNPNNPTGQLMSREALTETLTYCDEHGIELIVDEAFMDFVEAEDRLSLISEIESTGHLYVLRSLTKFYAIPGLRLGYLLTSNQTMLKEMRRRQIPWSINSLAAAVGQIIFSTHDYQQATLHLVNRQRSFLERSLSTFEPLEVYPSSSNYLLFKANGINHLQEKLLNEAILIRSCANYRGLTDQYFRVAVRSSAENQRLIEAIKVVIANE